MRVANRRCIRRLGIRSMKAAAMRNIIAVLAIALTTMLFTALFTIAGSIGYAVEQANFRQVGGYAHGAFKYLTEEQFIELREDALIKEWGVRRFVGMPEGEAFSKASVEVSWCDANEAKWIYAVPEVGRLPEEGTTEAATDTRVLSLLGIEPELGTEFTLTLDVDGKEITKTFTLCGWWEYDSVCPASHVLVPESCVDEILAERGELPEGSVYGLYTLDMMFQNSANIVGNIKEIVTRHGYQLEDGGGENYISCGINWGYMASQFAGNVDPMVVLAIIAMLMLIIFTGYLIIYNVFQISISNDIRFYGLLKTIGTTGRQIRHMVRIQAFALSVFGIPIGLLAGYGVGAALIPVVFSELNDRFKGVLSVNPAIFVGAALFALITVTISTRKPGRMAAKVSPVEAVRYTEGAVKGSRRTHRKLHRNTRQKAQASDKASLRRMAWANLGRNRTKTVVTILSLTLAVVLLDMTVVFTKSFDMDKYVSKMMCTDFVLSDASYIRGGYGFWSDSMKVPRETIDDVIGTGNVSEGGAAYGCAMFVWDFVTEEYYRQKYSAWYTPEALEQAISNAKWNKNGLLSDNAGLYGMEDYVLDHLKVVSGSTEKLYEDGDHYAAAVYLADDYGEVETDSNWAKVGDKITLRFEEEYAYYDLKTGELLDPEHMDGREDFYTRTTKYKDVEYEIVAEVIVPSSLSYRYGGPDMFLLNAQTFIQDTGTDSVMLYAFDAADGTEDAMESFLADYTKEVLPQLDYESKAIFEADFYDMQNTYLMLGGVLSFIVGLVGILNFLNAILTGIVTRRREFAVLQSIGMTGRQLKQMLVWEGIFYALGSVVLSLVLSVALGPLAGKAFGSLFWFITYHATVMPVLAVAPCFIAFGVVIPLFVYRVVSKRTIVERLRETE